MGQWKDNYKDIDIDRYLYECVCSFDPVLMAGERLDKVPEEDKISLVVCSCLLLRAERPKVTDLKSPS